MQIALKTIKDNKDFRLLNKTKWRATLMLTKDKENKKLLKSSQQNTKKIKSRIQYLQE